MTTQATIIAHSGNKKLKLTTQTYKDGSWQDDDGGLELDPRLYGQRTHTMYEGKRVIIEELGDFLT